MYQAPEPAENPGDWSNAGEFVKHVLTRALTDPVVGLANLMRTPYASDAPLYKEVNDYNENGSLIGSHSELTDYGKGVDNGSVSGDPLGKLVIGLDAYNNITSDIDKKNPLPHTFLGNTATGVIKIAPDLAMTALFPEDKLVGEAGAAAETSRLVSNVNKLKNAVWNPFTKVMATKGFLKGYDEAQQKGEAIGGSMVDALKQGSDEAVNAGLMGLLGGVSGEYIAPKIYKSLVESNIVAGGKLTQLGVNAISDAATFGAYPIMSSIAQGKKIDLDEIESSAGMGFAFGSLKGLKNFKGWDAADEKLKNVWADRYAMATQNFMNASPDAIDNVVNYGQTDSDLFAQATQMAAKDRVEMDPAKKTQYAAMASTLAKMSDIRGTVDAIVHDPEGFIENIKKSDLPADQKEALIQRAQEITKQYAGPEAKAPTGLIDSRPQDQEPAASPAPSTPTVDNPMLNDLDDELDNFKQSQTQQANENLQQPEVASEQPQQTKGEKPSGEVQGNEENTAFVKPELRSATEGNGLTSKEPVDDYDINVVKKSFFKNTALRSNPDLSLEEVRKESVKLASERGNEKVTFSDFEDAVHNIIKKPTNEQIQAKPTDQVQRAEEPKPITDKGENVSPAPSNEEPGDNKIASISSDQFDQVMKHIALKHKSQFIKIQQSTLNLKEENILENTNKEYGSLMNKDDAGKLDEVGKKRLREIYGEETLKKKAKALQEMYDAAKQDGSDPEFVKYVDDALNSKEPEVSKAPDSTSLDKYYTADKKLSGKDQTFTEVEGTPINNKHGLDLFLHRDKSGDFFDVSEGTTGVRIAEGKTANEAIANAHAAIKQHGIEKVNQLLDEKRSNGVTTPRGKSKSESANTENTEAVIAKATTTLRKAEVTSGGDAESAGVIDDIDNNVETIDKEIKNLGGDPEQEPPPETDNEPPKDEKKAKREKYGDDLKAAKKAFMDTFNKALSGINPETIEKGIKLLAVYAKIGIHDFGEIVKDLYEDAGEKARDIFDGLKAAYGAFATSEEATDEQIDRMTDLRDVRKAKFEDYIPKIKDNDTGSKSTAVDENSSAVVKGEPAPGTGNIKGALDFLDNTKEKNDGKFMSAIIQIPPAAWNGAIDVMKNILKAGTELQGKLSGNSNLSPDEKDFAKLNLSNLTRKELHRYVEVAAVLSVDPQGVLTSDVNDLLNRVGNRINPKGGTSVPPITPPPEEGGNLFSDDDEPRKRIPKKDKQAMDGSLDNLPEQTDAEGKPEAKDNYSAFGRFKDIRVRNLEQLKEYGKDLGDQTALRNVRQYATSKSQASIVMKTATDRIIKAVGKDGWDLLRKALVESRLRGIKQRWDNWSKQIKRSSDNEIDDLFAEGKNSLMYDIISRLDGYENDPKPEQTILGMITNDQYDDAREYMSDMFANAGDNVAFFYKMGNGKTFDDMVHDGEFTDPKMQQAFESYRDLMAKPFEESHAANEGIFSDALGPLDTYYPLVPVGADKHFVVTPGTKYRAPENPNNKFATGQGEMYSTALSDLSHRLSNAIRTSNKAMAINSLETAGLIARVSKDSPDTGYINVNGELYTATKALVQDQRLITSDGKTVVVPARYVLMPTWLYKEVKPIFEDSGDLHDDFSLFGRINNIGIKLMLGGPIEASSHSYRLLGGIVNSMPYMQEWAYKNGILGHAGGLVLNNPFVKTFAGMVKILFSDISSDEAMETIQEMAKLGIIPEKTWQKTWSKEFAELTGAKNVPIWDFSPILYGKNSIDLKSRVLLYRLTKAMNPQATPEQIVTMQNELGNYTIALQGELEKFVKRHGLAPFYSFGGAIYRSGIKSVFGASSLPLTRPSLKEAFTTKLGAEQMAKLAGYKMGQLLSAGIVGLLGFWALTYKEQTDKWPWEDKHSKLLKVPFPKQAVNQVTRKMFADEKTGEMPDVDFSFFNPFINRGIRAIGAPKTYETHQLGGTVGQDIEAGSIQAINTNLSPYTSSPAIQLGVTTLTGDAPYITGIRDRFTGVPELGFFRKTNTFSPGLQIPANLAVGAAGMNPLVNYALSPLTNSLRYKYAPEDNDAYTAAKSIFNTIIPHLLTPHGSDDFKEKAIEMQAKAIQTSIKKEKEKQK